MGYTASFDLGSCSTSPVLGSYSQPCHGQTSLLPSMYPWPSGPPMCRQTLSMAVITPFTLATQMVLSLTSNSLASPSAGSSDWVVSLTRGIGIRSTSEGLSLGSSRMGVNFPPAGSMIRRTGWPFIFCQGKYTRWVSESALTLWEYGIEKRPKETRDFPLSRKMVT